MKNIEKDKKLEEVKKMMEGAIDSAIRPFFNWVGILWIAMTGEMFLMVFVVIAYMTLSKSGVTISEATLASALKALRILFILTLALALIIDLIGLGKGYFVKIRFLKDKPELKAYLKKRKPKIREIASFLWRIVEEAKSTEAP